MSSMVSLAHSDVRDPLIRGRLLLTHFCEVSNDNEFMKWEMIDTVNDPELLMTILQVGINL